jgi:glycosyltransferase involved in cell wall biosynthesis
MKILIVAFDFPPYVNGGGVIRTQKFCKYLARKGHALVVLSAAQRYRGAGQVPDDLNHNGIHRVYTSYIDWFRTLGSVTRWLTGWLPKKSQGPTKTREMNVVQAIDTSNETTAKIKRWVLKVCFPDEHFLWIPWTVLAWAVRHSRNHSPDCVYVTAPPFASCLVGYFLSLLYDKPLFLDYRDSWSGNELYRHKATWLRRMEERWERRILKRAEKVIVTTPPMKRDLQERFGGSIDCEVITNGYDEEDFESVRTVRKEGGCFIIGYFGGIDVGRDPLSVFQAFRELKDEGFDPDDRVRFEFTGHFPFNKGARMLGVDEWLHHRPPVSQRESVKRMLECQALLITIKKEQGSRTAIPGKTFEYLRAGKPILAVADDGALRDMFKDHRQFFFCYPESIADIKRTLVRLLDDWKSGRVHTATDEELLRFDRQNLCLRLERFLGAAPPIPKQDPETRSVGARRPETP